MYIQSIRFIWFNVLFKIDVCLLFFSMDDLSIDVSVILKQDFAGSPVARLQAPKYCCQFLPSGQP